MMSEIDIAATIIKKTIFLSPVKLSNHYDIYYFFVIEGV